MVLGIRTALRLERNSYSKTLVHSVHSTFCYCFGLEPVMGAIVVQNSIRKLNDVSDHETVI